MNRHKLYRYNEMASQTSYSKAPLTIHIMRFVKFVLDTRPDWYPEGKLYISPDDNYDDCDAKWILCGEIEKFIKHTTGQIFDNLHHILELDEIFYIGPNDMPVNDAIGGRLPIYYMTYDQIENLMKGII